MNDFFVASSWISFSGFDPMSSCCLDRHLLVLMQDFFCLSPLPFSTVLSLTRGPAGYWGWCKTSLRSIIAAQRSWCMIQWALISSGSNPCWSNRKSQVFTGTLFPWTVLYVLQLSTRRVFRNVSDIWFFIPVRLTEAWFPLRVLLLLSHVFLYGDVFGSFLCFDWFIDDSAHKTSFLQLSWPCSQCRFCVLCAFFGVWRVVFFTAATLADSEPAIGQKSSPSYEVTVVAVAVRWCCAPQCEKAFPDLVF